MKSNLLEIVWLPFFYGTQMELFVAVQAALLNTKKVNGDHACQARFTVINYISGCSSNKSIIWHHKTWNIEKSHMDYFYDFFSLPSGLIFSLEKSSSNFKTSYFVYHRWKKVILFGTTWRWVNDDRILISERMAVCEDH